MSEIQPDQPDSWWDALPPEGKLAIGAGITAALVMMVYGLLSPQARKFVWILIGIVVILMAAGVGVNFTRN